MREELLEYYERELTYLRQMGGEFARKYPKVAGRLLLDPDRCDDPHVNRLLEGFGFLAARIHRRIDDDFPEICESLTRVIHPGYLRPTPSMTIVECQPDPAQGKKTAGMRIPRGTQLVSKVTVDGLPCRFQTAYDVDLWPFSVATAEWRQPERMQRPPRASVGVQAVAAARLRLRCLKDVVFSGLPISRLRFYLAGDASVVYSLYELLAEKCIEIQLRDPKDEKKLISLEPARLQADQLFLILRIAKLNLDALFRKKLIQRIHDTRIPGQMKAQAGKRKPGENHIPLATKPQTSRRHCLYSHRRARRPLHPLR